MADSVKIRAGSKENMPKLPDRELGWVRDEKELYIGTPSGNVAVTAELRVAMEQIAQDFQAVLDRAYPVGTVFTSVSADADPASVIGGTWEAVVPLSPYIKDDTTGQAYRIGVDSGGIYVESVETAPTYYSWKRIG